MGKSIPSIQAVPAIRPIDAPTAPAGISPPAAADKPEAPGVPAASDGSAGRDTPQTPIDIAVRHDRIASSNRQSAGTTGIYRIDIDLYEGRTAFLSRHGPPLRGYVGTDLDEGIYALTLDETRKRWNILNPVKSGLRFKVLLDGADPFSLSYEQPMVLSVSAGLQSSGNIDSVAEVIAILDGLSNAASWIFLSNLCDVLLEDVLDQLWSGEALGQATVMQLLSGFEEAVRRSESPLDIARVLRAIEGFATKPSDLYVDAFTKYFLDPDSRNPDPDRSGGLSTAQIRFVYDKSPPARSIVIYADDIDERNDRPDPLPRSYGAANLLYPQWLNAATAPRMTAAKKAIMERLEYENIVSIIEQAHGAFEEIQMAWTIYGFAQPLISGLLNLRAGPDKWAGSAGAARASGAPWRWKGIKPASSGPGKWVGDFEGGANMSTRSSWYQLDAAGTPPGWGYRCGGIQFENFINGMLIDAKDWAYWGTVGRSMRGISDSASAMSKIQQARTQLHVAQRAGVGLEWRCSSSQLIPTIRAGLDGHGLRAIRLVHVPYRAPPPGWSPKIPSRLFRK